MSIVNVHRQMRRLETELPKEKAPQKRGILVTDDWGGMEPHAPT